MNGKQKFFLLLVLFQVLLFMIVFFSVNGIIIMVAAQGTDNTLDYYKSPTPGMLGIAAGIAIGLSVLGSGIAIKTVGTSAISALTERDEAFFKAFLVVALAEALAVYGLIIAVLLWTKIPAPPTS